MTFLIAWLVAWTPAALVLRLRSLRPTLRKLGRTPGFAATLVASAILALGVVAIASLALVRAVRRYPLGSPPLGSDSMWWMGVVFHFAVYVGPSVIGAWLILAVTGRRRPSRDWQDVLGRLLGTAWIVVFVVNCCFRLAAWSG